MMRTRLGPLTVALALLGGVASACKPTAPASSVLKDEAGTAPRPGACECRDLACWKSATKDGVTAQLSCVNSALGAAANLASAGTVAAAQTGAGALEMAKAFEKRFVLAADGAVIAASATSVGVNDGKATSVLDMVKALATGSGDALKFIGGADYTKAPVLNCFKNVNDVVKNIVDISGNVMKAADKLPDDITGVVPVLKTLVASAETIVNGLTLLDNCIGRLEGPQAEVGRNLKAISDGMKKIMSQVKTVFAFVDCGVGFYRGGKVLFNNTQCAFEDLEALAESDRAVARSLAFVGTRQFNHAKYIGCTECVNSSYWDSTQEEYDTCRSRCETKAGDYVPANSPKKKAAWITACQLTCGVVRTEGLLRDHNDISKCDDMKNMFPVSRHYRHIFISDESLPANSPVRLKAARDRRAEVLRHLTVIKNNYDAFKDAAESARGQNGHIQRADFIKVAETDSYSAEMRAAGEFFGKAFNNDGTPYFFRLLDTSDPRYPSEDNLIGTTDVGYFYDEVNEYRDESEF